MRLYPAIDLRGGAVVRLFQGDYAQSTIYTDDPVELAQVYEEAGASWLHLVDLDGAKGEASENLYVIEEIATRTALRIQAGGGVRNAADLQRMHDVGVARVVIGSLAVREPELVREWFRSQGSESLCLAADVRGAEDGNWYVQVSGWTQASVLTLNEFIERYQDVDLRHALCTDVSRDGTLAGPNVDLYRGLVKQFPWLQVQASGGVSSLADLQALAAAEVDGAIIGKALLEHRFTLEEAAACLPDA